MITTYNTAVLHAASEIFGKERPTKKTWATKDVFDLLGERYDLMKKQYVAEGAEEYKETNKRIGAQCEEIETCLNKNKSKRASGEGSNLSDHTG